MTPAEFKIRFPEFATESDDRVQMFLDDAALSVSERAWSTKYDLGLAYLAAHLLASANRGSAGVSGPVTSEKVGDLQRSYAAASSNIDATYSTTGYGIEFIRLRKTIFTSPIVT
jgi:hypothetical protein